jgi:hypothetical protein
LTENEWVVTDSIERKMLLEPTNVPPLQSRDEEMRVVIGIPMERTIMQEAFFGFVRIFQQGWSMARLAYTRNDIARHKFCEFLLGSDYTHLLMLDSDHEHPEDIVPRLARWFQAYPDLVQVAGGLNFRRGEPYDPCAFVDPGDGAFHRMAEWGTGLVEVDALGSGSIMIARSALETIEPPWWDYQYPDHTGWPGTDMTFSARCREYKIPLWCDTTTVSPHIGTMMIGEAEYRRFIASQGAQA